MKRELAKVRELSFGIYDSVHPRTRKRELSHFCTSPGKKWARWGEIRSHKLRLDRGRYRR